MKNILKDLIDLQQLELQGPIVEQERRLKSLRKKVPESILGVFDCWIRRGKKAVAVVRSGVCCECHLKVASGLLANLAKGTEIERCGNCGRMLCLPQDECVRSLPLSTPLNVAQNRTNLTPKCQKASLSNIEARLSGARMRAVPQRAPSCPRRRGNASFALNRMTAARRVKTG